MKPLPLAVLFAAGCGTTIVAPPEPSPTGPAGSDVTIDEPLLPPPPDNTPYTVTSTIVLSVEAILPAQAEDVVSDLRTFSTDPAQALINLATQAGVPAIGTLYSVLPSVLKDQLNGWIDDALAPIQIGGMSIQAWAGQIADLADASLSQFAVDSQLALTPPTATQTLTAIDFNPAGFDVVLPIPGLVGDILTQNPPMTIGDAGAFSLGDQRFGLNYGEYAWDAINLAVTAQFGGDIQTELTNAVDCPSLAATVANNCVLDVCVGHEQDLQSICTGGLDALVTAVHTKLASYRFDVFEFSQGTGTLIDSDHIANGVWTAQMDLGAGLRHTPATFVGAR